MVRATQKELKDFPEINLARRLVARFNLSPPVDVLTLARKYADVSIEALPFNADGVCYDLKKSGTRPKIVLNGLRPKTRLRFTLAHELGHVLIPWHTGIMVDDTTIPPFVMASYSEMEPEANRFASELLIPGEWVLSTAGGFANPIDLIIYLSEKANVSHVAALIKLVPLLEPGHVYAQLDREGLVEMSGRSPGTLTESPIHGELPRGGPHFPFIEHFWKGEIRGHKLLWWKLPSQISMPEAGDGRDWRQILDEILNDLSEFTDEHHHIRQSINGIIGAINGKSSKQLPEEIYASLLLRFEARRKEGGFYKYVVGHPKFSDFLIRRLEAMVK